MCSGNEGKIRRPRQQEVKSVKDTEYTKKNQMDILELRNMTTAVKARRMIPRNRAEERVIEMEDRITKRVTQELLKTVLSMGSIRPVATPISTTPMGVPMESKEETTDKINEKVRKICTIFKSRICGSA